MANRNPAWHTPKRGLLCFGARMEDLWATRTITNVDEDNHHFNNTTVGPPMLPSKEHKGTLLISLAPHPRATRQTSAHHRISGRAQCLGYGGDAHVADAVR